MTGQLDGGSRNIYVAYKLYLAMPCHIIKYQPKITMKKLLLILLLPLAMASCKTYNYTTNIGMTEAEFTQQKKTRTSLIEKTAHRTTYKRVSGWDGERFRNSQYFYFIDGKLVRIADREIVLSDISY